MRKRALVTVLILTLILIGLWIYQVNMTGNAVKSTDPVTRTVKYSKGLWQVTLKSNVNSYAFGVSEQIPENATVIKVSAQGIVKENTIEWLFAPARRNIMTYTLEGLNATKIDFSGSWYTVEGEGNITGTGTWIKK